MVTHVLAFILLTSAHNNAKIVINLNRVKAIVKSEDEFTCKGTFVSLDRDDYICVKETPREIYRMIDGIKKK